MGIIKKNIPRRAEAVVTAWLVGTFMLANKFSEAAFIHIWKGWIKFRIMTD